MYTVYELINNQNQKKYFGVTSAENPEDRWKEGYRHNKLLHNDILSIGLENFTKTVIKQTNSKEEALKLESELIVKYDTTNLLKGYNIFTNKENSHHNQEYLTNLSQRTTGKNNPRYGKKLSDETKKKISESNKGKHLSEEAKRKISEANKNKIVSKETREKLSEVLKGRQFSEETKKKMSESAKNREYSEEFKQKCRERQSNMIWINKDGKSSCVQKERLHEYLNLGWIKGRGKLNKHTKNYIKDHTKDNGNYSKAASERVWLHKGNQKTHCNRTNNEKLISLLNDGWQLGMK